MFKQPGVVHICHLLYRKEWSGQFMQRKQQNYAFMIQRELESFSLWGIVHFQIKKKCPLPARALIMTNSLGKAFGPIINTSPMRSHLCLRPDRPVASHIRASVSEQISIHTRFCPYEHRLSGLPA